MVSGMYTLIPLSKYSLHHHLKASNLNKRRHTANLSVQAPRYQILGYYRQHKTRSSWLNCALRDDEAVYWVSIGHYKAVAVGN